MKDEKISVYGIYPTRLSAELAVDELQRKGFRNDDVSVLFSSDDTTKEFSLKNSTKVPEGTATGAISGGTVGGVLGWLVGIGSIAIPGVGPFIAAGPIMAALAGASIGGTVGGLAGALVGMGIPEYEANRYENRLGDGGVLLSVHSDNSEWAKKARDILERTGAEDISRKSEASGKRDSSDRDQHTNARHI